ncbi:MAG: hypothetical protein KGP28_05070 [Bdellovibrionales bacterium]|nr:hypothetical protein [Bdellovibrionales bacterium]
MISKIRHRSLHLALLGVMIPVIIFAFGSCANYNSNTFDATAYLDTFGDPNDPNFAASFKIIEEKCSWCHYHKGQYPSLITSQRWVESGQVVPGSPQTSPLFLKLKNPSGGGGNMPQDLPPLSSTEYSTIQSWIQNIPGS